ncbi:MAG: hypothetical protein PHI27_07775 [Eubacteriales bacterium]|nr:hypothetical protein [Eubacteriales bacterium]MDD3882135.1 hypothetical protein [Eubacteriales bacterium]MDD4513240.1 hypothetical protein [Eubacteriales bacterium]
MSKYLIAGHVIKIKGELSEIKDSLSDYAYTGKKSAEREFTMSKKQFDRAARGFVNEYRTEIENYFFALEFSGWLAKNDGMYLHSAAVMYKGFGYMFTAPSGSGKSTHANLWRQAFGYDEVTFINDDKPLIVRENGGFFVCGAPWHGKENEQRNVKAPLRAICVIEKAKENSITRLEAADALNILLSQSVIPRGRKSFASFADMLDDLLSRVPVFKLRCNISEDAARLAYSAMSEQQTGFGR